MTRDSIPGYISWPPACLVVFIKMFCRYNCRGFQCSFGWSGISRQWTYSWNWKAVRGIWTRPIGLVLGIYCVDQDMWKLHYARQELMVLYIAQPRICIHSMLVARYNSSQLVKAFVTTAYQFVTSSKRYIEVGSILLRLPVPDNHSNYKPWPVTFWLSSAREKTGGRCVPIATSAHTSRTFILDLIQPPLVTEAVKLAKDRAICSVISATNRCMVSAFSCQFWCFWRGILIMHGHQVAAEFTQF